MTKIRNYSICEFYELYSKFAPFQLYHKAQNILGIHTYTSIFGIILIASVKAVGLYLFAISPKILLCTTFVVGVVCGFLWFSWILLLKHNSILSIRSVAIFFWLAGLVLIDIELMTSSFRLPWSILYFSLLLHQLGWFLIWRSIFHHQVKFVVWFLLLSGCCTRIFADTDNFISNIDHCCLSSWMDWCFASVVVKMIVFMTNDFFFTSLNKSGAISWKLPIVPMKSQMTKLVWQCSKRKEICTTSQTPNNTHNFCHWYSGGNDMKLVQWDGIDDSVL